MVAVALMLALLALDQATQAIGTLERHFYDFASTRSSRLPSSRIAIIAIDDQSIASIGRWPWPRDVHAQLVDQLAAAKAGTVVYTTFFFEPQTDRGLVFIRKIKEVLGPMPEAQVGPAGSVVKLIAEAEGALDTDARLAASIARAGNVLVPSWFQLGATHSKADVPLPAYVARSALPPTGGFSLAAIRGDHPIESIGRAAAGIGHLNQLNDVDGVVREDPLLVDYDGNAIPSISLLTAARSLKLQPGDLRIDPGQSVRLGKLLVKTDGAARMLPRFYGATDGKPPFPVDSFQDVLAGKIPAARYADKIVLVGVTAAALGSTFATPGHANLAPVEMVAHVTSSLLEGHFVVQPAWGTWAALALVLLVCGYLAALLPMLPVSMAAGTTALAFAGLLGSEFLLLSSGSLWLKFMLPAVLLVTGHLALAAKHLLLPEAGIEPGDPSADSDRMMGLALQGQGQLDAAFERLRRVPMSEPLMENLYHLALDFERKDHLSKARSVYEHMAAFDLTFKDLENRLHRARNLPQSVIVGNTASQPGSVGDKPMLGRYQVERELGKGAMGVVYLGRDPKIGRIVAIKTMALSQEFEAEELTDARERFFREAETAGRLQHQHIVTIFDAGEDHGLAYIAMEFLKGKDLAEFCRDGQLLALPKVLSLVARVAEALAYAHKQNVVHRDIKPANIMYEAGSDIVKVTDFGIARITDSSKTKTGLVLGTPSYMSPEQIAGKKVDGRSDLYSLGVMLFQMLTGVLPFGGESMAELMHKIANEEAPDIRIVRKEIPPRLANVVALALSKRVETRYQDGDELAADLRFVMGEVSGARPAASAPRAGDSDKTVVMAAGRPEPASAALRGAASGAPPRGYDATGRTAGGRETFAETHVIRKPALTGARAAGTDKTDLEA